MTWLVGILGGAVAAIGIIELVTGRLVVNPLRRKWTAGETRVRALVITLDGLAIAMVCGFVLYTRPGPTWTEPAWWPATPFIGLLGALAFGFMPLLLELHHSRIWPFTKRRAEGSS
jgi:hypothetical protein